MRNTLSSNALRFERIYERKISPSSRTDRYVVIIISPLADAAIQQRCELCSKKKVIILDQYFKIDNSIDEESTKHSHGNEENNVTKTGNI